MAFGVEGLTIVKKLCPCMAAAFSNPVLMDPGQMHVTVTPVPRTSRATATLSERTKAFEA